MRLVELSYFPGELAHQSRLIVNADHVLTLLAAAPGQCWLTMAFGGGQFLVQGSLDTVVAFLSGDAASRAFLGATQAEPDDAVPDLLPPVDPGSPGIAEGEGYEELFPGQENLAP